MWTDSSTTDRSVDRQLQSRQIKGSCITDRCRQILEQKIKFITVENQPTTTKYENQIKSDYF
jgi:hypothetical protein